MGPFNTASISSVVENSHGQIAIKLWDLMEKFLKITSVYVFYFKDIE